MARKTFACALLLLAGCARREAAPPAAQASPGARPFELDTRTPLADPLPRVAGRVNGHEIPTSQVVAAAEAALRQGAVKEKILAYRQSLNQYVVRELLLEEALQRGIAPGAADVERAYDEARVAYRDEERWSEELKKQGLTPQGFREELRAKQTVSLLLSQEAEKVQAPSEVELREVYSKLPAPQAQKEKPPFEAVQERLREQVWQAKRQEHVQALVNRLRSRARIETFL